MPKIEPIELKEFLEKTIKDIEDGVDISSRSIAKDGIEIEVTTVTTSKIDGSVKVYVLGAGGEQKQENVARLKFNVMSDYSKARSKENQLINRGKGFHT